MSDRSESPPRKRARQTEEKEEEDPPPESSASLLDISNDILLGICRRLDSLSLYSLSETCHRFQGLVSEKSLWVRADTGSSCKVSLPCLRKMVSRFFNPRTESFRIQGLLKKDKTSVLSTSLFTLIGSKAPGLKVLSLDQHLIDAHKLKISDFPPELSQLRELHLTSSSVINALDKEPYFRELHLKFPNLRVLNLSGSPWVTNHSLLAIGKLEALEELSLNGCYRIGECFVYTALATRFGFRNLRIIDLRGTFVGNPEMQCIGRLPRITQAYFGDIRSSRPSFSEGDGRIEDRGIASLIDLESPSNLTHLSLQKTELSDKMLACLAKKLPLEFLDIRNTRVTKEGVEEFMELKPKCKLLHST